MKTFIAQNKFYEIAIDKQVNRIYLKIIGFWRTKEEVAGYILDISNALANLKMGFTLLADLTEMKTHPVEMRDIHLEAQHVLVSQGLKQTAEVYINLFVQSQTGNLSRISKMPLKQFTTYEEAENYLDLVLV